jgi:hypothetical protein
MIKMTNRDLEAKLDYHTQQTHAPNKASTVQETIFAGERFWQLRLKEGGGGVREREE